MTDPDLAERYREGGLLLAALERELARRGQEIAELAVAVELSEAGLRSARAEREASEARAAELRDELARARHELAHVRNELESTLASRSWRLTRPLRLALQSTRPEGTR